MRRASLVGLLSLVTALVVPAAAASGAPGAPGQPAVPAQQGPPPLPAHAEKRVCGTPAANVAECDAHVVTQPDAVTPLATTSYSNGYAPSSLQLAYALGAPTGAPGTGPVVAIVDAYDNPNAEADLAAYRQQFNLGVCSTANGCFQKVNQNGGSVMPAGDTGWGSEIDLDIDMVSATCPNCGILLVEANSNSFSDLVTAVHYAATHAKYVSNSYGGGEFSGEASYQSNYHYPGVAITASSGDGGYGVEFPAASQYVTAVGGTSLSVNASLPRGWSETAWSGAGSGCSRFISKPSWQTDSGCSMRTVADVSAVANPSTGVAVYDSYGSSGGANWFVYGGTSVASPIIASVYALAGTPGANDTPASYPYSHTSSLYDVTSGKNANFCSPSYLCTAITGFDGPTGLGTPNGLAAFAAAPVVVTVPGQPSGLTANPGDTTVALTWAAPSNNGGATVTSYNIFRSTISGAEAFLTSTATTSYNDSGLTNGVTYYYKVAAVNSAGQGNPSGEASATPNVSPPVTVPSAPQNLTAGPAAGKGVQLNWQAPTSNGGSAITGYNIYRGTSAGGEGATPIATSTSTSFKDANTSRGQTYYYFVKAVNSAGTGAQSNEASAKAK